MSDKLVLEPNSNDFTFEFDNLHIIDITEYQKQELEISPTTEKQTFIPDMGTVYDKVIVNAVDSSISPNILADNIRLNVDILGVKGNLVPPDNASFVKFVDIQKELFENLPFVERDYNDTEIEKINTLLDKICRVGGY